MSDRSITKVQAFILQVCLPPIYFPTRHATSLIRLVRSHFRRAYFRQLVQASGRLL